MNMVRMADISSSWAKRSITRKSSSIQVDAKEIKLELTIAGQPKPFAAKATADTGDPADKSSRFEVADNPDIKANIKDEEDLKGSVTAAIGGKTYTGKIVHEH
jgi:hypothetical protein